ncbi:protein of unknown function [Lachnospiraceae bacterium XBB2008]|nr:protein of unknown function [Lachnospiraceae bacterium XBB2008]
MSKQKNTSNILFLIIAGCMILVLVLLAIIFNIINRIPDNPPTLTGNTAGNLNNGGYFCESNGKVYFANAYDHGYLYSMNVDQTDLKRLYNSDCSNICVGGKYLYFCMETPKGGTGLGFVIKTSGIYRATETGSKVKCLTSDDSLIMNLVGNTLYYQAGTGTGVGLKKVDMRGDEEEQVIEDTFVLNPACVVDGTIYYGGTQKDHYLYAYNPVSDTSNAIWEGDVWNPVYEGEYFYYMDISDDYKICRYSPMNQTVEILSHDRADNFNVGYGMIYYVVSVGEAPGLYRMRLDGSGKEPVALGYFCDVNMTSTYTYYRTFNTDTPIYCVPTAGGSPYEFTVAREAAEKSR